MEKKTGKESMTKQSKDEKPTDLSSLEKMLDSLGIPEVDPPKTVTVIFKK